MRILAPFRVRDFALYWTARAVSMLGGGVMAAALPSQVYELTDSRAATGLVGGSRHLRPRRGVLTALVYSLPGMRATEGRIQLSAV